MKLIFLDLLFLVVFGIFLSVFLYSRRKKLDREGLLFLYRTQWGIKLINYVGTKYKKTLKILSYVSVGLGYILMVTMLYLIGKIFYIYIRYPQIVRAIKVPPIMPLIPYLPQIFKIDFLPPFYFTYWIVIIAIIAITHEFSHGIFAKYIGVEVKSTGFGFLGPFLAAFVEPDEKKMNKKDKFSQLSVLSAGTFANIVTAIFFLIILGIFFYVSFVPSGVIFDAYSYSPVQLDNINYVNGIKIQNISIEKVILLMNVTGFNEIRTEDRNYLATKDMVEQQTENDLIVLYDDAPAIRNNLSGAIIEIDGVKIESVENLGYEIKKHKIGDEIEIKTLVDNEIKEYNIILEESPSGNAPWIGIGFSQSNSGGLVTWLYEKLSFFKKSNVYYAPRNESVIFFYNLLWWIILISISVALVNMLPVGIFDGGRVFYLTMLAIFKNEKIARKIFVFVTYFFLALLLALMFFWVISFR